MKITKLEGRVLPEGKRYGYTSYLVSGECWVKCRDVVAPVCVPYRKHCDRAGDLNRTTGTGSVSLLDGTGTGWVSLLGAGGGGVGGGRGVY